MDRRQFMAGSLTGLSVAWAQAGQQGGNAAGPGGFASLDAANRLPELSPTERLNSVPSDWLVTPFKQETAIYRTVHRNEIAMTNGLIRRTWRLRPNAATVGFDNLMTGASILRGVKPEAYVEINWQHLTVGGLKGQPDYAYLTAEWVDRMTADPDAMQCTGFKTGKTKARFAWKRTRFQAISHGRRPGLR